MRNETHQEVNPQVENGSWFPIRNDIWEAIQRTKFSLHERKILDLIIRLTYGCGQKVCFLESYTNLRDAGCLYSTQGRKTLESLEDKRVLIIDWRHKAILFNKYYNTWQVEIYDCFKQESLDSLVSANLKAKRKSQSVITALSKRLNQLKMTEAVKSDRTSQTKVTEPVKNKRSKMTEPVTRAASKVNDSKRSQPRKNSLKDILKTEEQEPVYNSLQIIEEPILQTDNSAKGLFVFQTKEERENFEDLRAFGITPIETAKAIIENNRDNGNLVRKGIYAYMDTEQWGPQYLIGILRKIGVKC